MQYGNIFCFADFHVVSKEKNRLFYIILTQKSRAFFQFIVHLHLAEDCMKQYNQTALKDICAVEQVGLI